MSDKYIIRNCNVVYFNLDKTAICNDLNLECPCECKERAHCLLKQIVELCKDVNKKFYDSVHQRYLSPSKAKFARQILELLDIEECDE